ncbi:polyketide cyclase/dehydrase/lipid transport protein [Mumia flava]|uniref:Polyketide cyclase/dehydrase/lipid transport protein n=1 Tax=Mumia flava TaxID=1348852 RepID=A0A0B2BDV6_9ACTN|nr:SRPBCC family protein [Mumia flava]PJJ55921.1 polyketide cyclase/dehydrase/lipid transport protein [Mumia flava]
MTGQHYSFRARWTLPVGRSRALDVLADLERYGHWWPEVRSVVGIDEDTARVTIRAALPYTLRLTLHRRRVDHDVGHLEAEIAGDLEGWASWRVRDDDGRRTRLDYRQEVVTTSAWMNVSAPFLQPLFRANHAVMMRRGQAGVTRMLRQASTAS